MYFNRKNNFPHGLMFHHFHDNKSHKSSQGSITADQLYEVIKVVGRKNILDPNIFMYKFKNKKLKKKDLCLTFDDLHKCQVDIALPVLKKLKVKAFFFVYTKAIGKRPNDLEIFRFFRNSYYENINNFYEDFFEIFLNFNKKFKLDKFFIEKKKGIEIFSKKYTFYSDSDIKFRIIRDEVLSRSNYSKIMHKLFKKKNFNLTDYSKQVFLSEVDIKKIDNLGHSIGLHSHSHPTSFKKLSYKEQLNEYSKNKKILENIIGKNKIFSMSHPCSQYNQNTFKVLKKLNIDIGFKANMFGKNKISRENYNFEIAREDYTNIKNRLNLH